MRSDGTIVEVEDTAEAMAEAKRRNLIPVPENERAKVEAMTPEQRREWYKAQLYKRELANRVGRRRTKNARKRQRKARRRLRASMKRRGR